LEKLEAEIQNYFGVLQELAVVSEVAPGSTLEIPELPEAVIYYLKMKATGLPMVGGGLINQPHIFLEELKVVSEAYELQSRLSQQAK
jgi:hypothetical protein